MSKPSAPGSLNDAAGRLEGRPGTGTNARPLSFSTAPNDSSPGKAIASGCGRAMSRSWVR